MHRCMLIFRKRRQSETYLDTSNRPHPTLLSGRLSVILCPRLCSQLEWGQGRLVVINLAKSMQKTRFQERRSSCVPGALQHRPAEKWTRLDLTYSSSNNSTIVTEARHDNRFHRLLLRDRQIYSQLGASTDGIVHRKQDSKPRYILEKVEDLKSLNVAHYTAEHKVCIIFAWGLGNIKSIGQCWFSPSRQFINPFFWRSFTADVAYYIVR